MMIWYIIYNIVLVGRKQKRSKMTFPYDEANNVHGLTKRKKKIETKRQIEFWEKHNRYSEKSTMNCCDISMFLLLSYSFLFFRFLNKNLHGILLVSTKYAVEVNKMLVIFRHEQLS